MTLSNLDINRKEHKTGPKATEACTLRVLLYLVQTTTLHKVYRANKTKENDKSGELLKMFILLQRSQFHKSFLQTSKFPIINHYNLERFC